jgi:predicted 3-demethylubiquinone-9 3-methyltransferase (glyoxalase superfamily)
VGWSRQWAGRETGCVEGIGHAPREWGRAAQDLEGGLMPKVTPFLWFNDNAEEAAEYYLALFPGSKKLAELRSRGVGPWPEGKIATITIELMGQELTFMNGGPAHAHTPAFSLVAACKDQAELDHYWDRLLEGGQAMACGWLTDKFGLCWQIVPERIGDILKHPKAMAAMMTMVKFDIAALELAAED